MWLIGIHVLQGPIASLRIPQGVPVRFQLAHTHAAEIRDASQWRNWDPDHPFQLQVGRNRTLAGEASPTSISFSFPHTGSREVRFSGRAKLIPPGLSHGMPSSAQRRPRIFPDVDLTLVLEVVPRARFEATAEYLSAGARSTSMQMPRGRQVELQQAQQRREHVAGQRRALLGSRVNVRGLFPHRFVKSEAEVIGMSIRDLEQYAQDLGLMIELTPPLDLRTEESRIAPDQVWSAVECDHELESGRAAAGGAGRICLVRTLEGYGTRIRGSSFERTDWMVAFTDGSNGKALLPVTSFLPGNLDQFLDVLDNVLFLAEVIAIPVSLLRGLATSAARGLFALLRRSVVSRLSSVRVQAASARRLLGGRAASTASPALPDAPAGRGRGQPPQSRQAAADPSGVQGQQGIDRPPPHRPPPSPRADSATSPQHQNQPERQRSTTPPRPAEDVMERQLRYSRTPPDGVSELTERTEQAVDSWLRSRDWRLRFRTELKFRRARRARSPRAPETASVFREEMIDRILAQNSHPLDFLLDENIGDFIIIPPGMGRTHRHLLHYVRYVQMGHLTSRHSGAPERMALQWGYLNQIESIDERAGLVIERTAVDIAGVPVERQTAQMLENRGLLRPGTVAAAPPSQGWRRPD